MNMTPKQKLFAIHELTQNASTNPTPLATLVKIAAVATAPETEHVAFETPVMRYTPKHLVGQIPLESLREVARPVQEQYYVPASIALPTGAPPTLDIHFNDGLARGVAAVAAPSSAGINEVKGGWPVAGASL